MMVCPRRKKEKTYEQHQMRFLSARNFWQVARSSEENGKDKVSIFSDFSPLT